MSIYLYGLLGAAPKERCAVARVIWSLVIDKLLTDLEQRGFEVIGISDNLVRIHIVRLQP
jgi:hypothetical protein